jgi:hypothetical protein
MLASRQSTALRIATHAERRILWAFIIIAVSVRLLYWFYTGRIWEDALITLTPARNLWEGFGLTHHFSEPRVHSFTSPISVLIPVIGEAFGQGILLIQICSLFAAAITKPWASRFCRVAGSRSAPLQAWQMPAIGQGLGKVRRISWGWIIIAHIRVLTRRLARYGYH